MKMSVIIEDNVICLDGECYSECNLDFIPKNIHAMQLGDECGEIEYIGETPNEKINACEYFDDLLLEFNKRKKEYEYERYLEKKKDEDENEEARKEQLRINEEVERLIKEQTEKDLQEQLERERKIQEEEIKLKNEEEEIIQKQILEQEEERKKQEEERKKQEEIENEIKQKMLKEQKEYENNRDYEKEFRSMRNHLLLYSDWTQLDNSPLSEEKRIEWEQYRQILRDLPQNFEDFESAVKDKNHPIWPQNPEKNINGEVNFE